MTDDLYASYANFKGWNEHVDRGHQEFTALLNKSGLAGPLNILEIGCGTGSYMDWAKQQGHRIEGTEIIPELIESVAKRGHVVHAAPVSADAFPPESFDAIVAIDVIEHFDINQLRDLMALAKKILKRDGRLIAQFPNGASPFSGRYQSGDFTHAKPLSPSAVRQIAEPMGMKFVSAFNPRSIPPGFARSLKRRLAYFARDGIEIILGHLYFGHRFPMDPNIVVTLGRAE